MRLLSAIYLMALAIFLSTPTYAVTESQNGKTILEQSLAASQEEVRLLKAQISLVKSYQDNLLSTVYWSLGTLVTIVGLLVGFGWYANFRIYERDRDALKVELSNLVNQELIKMQTEVRQEISAAASQAAAAAAMPATKAVERLERQLVTLNFDVIKNKISGLQKENAHGTIITESIKWLTLALHKNIDYQISKALTVIEESILANGGFTRIELTELTKLLDKVPDEHRILRERTKTALEKARLIV